MKPFFFALSFLFCLNLAAMEAAPDLAAEPAPAVQQEESSNNFCNMGRGVVNVVTCFLEVPRCMVYRNSQVPFWGFVEGAVRGSGLTALRAFSGVTDILFLGFDYGKMYNEKDFQEYVWKSPWLP